MQELVWVLEAHGYTPQEVRHGMNLLLSLPNFKAEHAFELNQALIWYGQGMDFANALHLALRGSTNQLLTFDKGFIKLGKKLGLRTQAVDWVSGVD
jgi:predicted nucleic-acid-binding protein